MSPEQIASYRQLVVEKNPPRGWRTWDEKGMHCNHCCNGDRCDDASHMDRNRCPYCVGTGVALWHPVFADADALLGDGA